jgi:RNA-directed DNA polymerase
VYQDIINVENLLGAWREFLRGKRKKKDVQEFGLRLMDNILDLHHALANKTYQHGPYHAFKINDPKPRDIHKAGVRDRLVHHALHRKLYPFFDRTFIADSYSCRAGKGAHKALNRFRTFAYKESKNHTRTCWVLKCDIKKFFANIDHAILKTILAAYISDKNILDLIGKVTDSFSNPYLFGAIAQNKYKRGLPLGNLTSQLLVNIYMNKFDQYVKHRLKAKYYIRYADDFVIMSHDRKYLHKICRYIGMFLQKELKLELHPDKISITTHAAGVDFLGWIHFPTHRVLRTLTKRRMLRNCAGKDENDPVSRSYLGLMTHGNAYRLQEVLREGESGRIPQ